MNDETEDRTASGLQRKHWRTATSIRRIFKEGFAQAELPYFNPHSFRKTLALLGEKLCRTPEEFKAWSQNLGHEKVMTAFSSYGTVQNPRQAEIMRKLAKPKNRDEQSVELALKLIEAAQNV